MSSYDMAALLRALGRTPDPPETRRPNNRFVKEYLLAKGLDESIASTVSNNELCYWTESELNALFEDLQASPEEIRAMLKSFPVEPHTATPGVIGREFVQPTMDELKSSANFLGALCVNRQGEFRINPEEGYAALSHVWSQGLGADDRNGGLRAGLLDQVFEKLEPLGVKWIWTDSLAIPGGKGVLSVMEEEIKALLINAMADIYRDASQVIILDALVLRLDSTDPVKVAAILSCGCKMFYTGVRELMNCAADDDNRVDDAGLDIPGNQISLQPYCGH